VLESAAAGSVAATVAASSTETIQSKLISASHSGDYEDLYLLGHNKHYAVRRKSTDVSDEHIASIFRVEKPSKKPIRSRKQAGLRLLHARFFLVLFFNPDDGGAETALDFHWTTRHYVPEDWTLQYKIQSIIIIK
jgi:hypothetical protein